MPIIPIQTVPQSFGNFADEMRRRGIEQYASSEQDAARKMANSGPISPAGAGTPFEQENHCTDCNAASKEALELSKKSNHTEAQTHAARAAYESKYKLHSDAARSHGKAAQEHAYATTRFKDSPSKVEQHTEARAAHEVAKKLHENFGKEGQ